MTLNAEKPLQIESAGPGVKGKLVRHTNCIPNSAPEGNEEKYLEGKRLGLGGVKLSRFINPSVASRKKGHRPRQARNGNECCRSFRKRLLNE